MTYSEGLSEALHKITFIGLVGYVIILSIIILFIIYKIHFETENEIKKDKKILLNLEEYRNFTYGKNIVLDGGIISVENRHHQHRVVYSKNGKEKELRSSQFNTWNSTYILEDRTANFSEMMKCFLKLQDVSYVEITMDKNIKDINELQKDNFPREIKFLDENKKIVLKQEFNEFGFMVRLIDEFQDFIYEDKEVLSFDSTESFILSKIKE